MEVHKVAGLIDNEAVVGPEGVVEGVVSVFAVVGVIGVKESSHVPHHVDAEFAVEIDFSLVEGPHSDTYLHTHYQNIYSDKLKHLNEWILGS